MSKNFSEKTVNKHIVFYDGDCGFCNFWIQWILKNDKKNKFLFASLQSDFGQNFLSERKLDSQNLNTIYLWKPEYYYLKKSEAIIKIAKLLGGKYSAFVLFDIFPKFISDKIYDLIAKNRKKIMNNNCLLPTNEEKGKFIV